MRQWAPNHSPARSHHFTQERAALHLISLRMMGVEKGFVLPLRAAIEADRLQVCAAVGCHGVQTEGFISAQMRANLRQHLVLFFLISKVVLFSKFSFAILIPLSSVC